MTLDENLCVQSRGRARRGPTAYCPALKHVGASTWGDTQEEALKHVGEVVEMIVKELIEDGEPIPADVQVSKEE